MNPKTMKKSKEQVTRYISPKKYLYALVILVGSILLTLYIFKWYQIKKEEKYITSFLISSKTIVSKIDDLPSLEQIRKETPSSYFIFLSYTGNEEVYNLERNLKRVIDKYNLNDIFYYVDLTELMKNETYLNHVQTSLEIEKIEKIPAIIYVHEGKIFESNILDGFDNVMLKASDLEHLLEVYEFEKVK